MFVTIQGYGRNGFSTLRVVTYLSKWYTLKLTIKPPKQENTMEIDLFGEPILTESDKKDGFFDEKLAEALIIKRQVCVGPTHKSKDGKYGEAMSWYPPRGDCKLKTMVIGFHPADAEQRQQMVLVGPTGIVLEQYLQEYVGVRLNDCYLTNLIKYYIPAGGSVPKTAVNICLPYLKREIELFQPELIICLGTEVFNHVTGYEGGIDDYRGSRFKHPDYPGVMSTVWLPSVILKSPDQTDIWINDLKSVFQKHNVMAATNWEVQDALPVHAIHNIKELELAVTAEIEKGTTHFAMDTEFDGDTWFDSTCFKLDISSNERSWDIQLFEPTQGYDPIMFPATKGKNKYSKDSSLADRILFDNTKELNAYIESHPFRTKPIAAFVREYTWVFGGTPEELGEQLNRLFRRDNVVIWGQYGRVDFKLLLRFGVNVFDKVDMDTITLALHLHESQPLGLEDLCKRYLAAPNHKLELAHWLKTNKVAKGTLPYSFVPRRIIDPYAVSDTRRTYDLRAEMLKELDILDAECKKKGEPSIKEAYFKYKMGQYNGLAEMEIIGQPINMEALKTNINWYTTQRDIIKKQCIERVCKETGWTAFNPESPAQIAKLLFDELKIMPLYSTDKPPVPWEKVLEMPIEEQSNYSPATNQETLETLASTHPICTELNNSKILSTLCKSYMRKGARWATAEVKKTNDVLELWAGTPIDVTPQEVEEEWDSKEEWDEIAKDKKSRALSQVVHPNGFLYSSYFELLETHRLATKPNISAIPKGEGRYIKDITGCAPPFEIRHLFQAPDDWIIAEADWVTGEVWLLMMLANDPEGIKQVSDPSKYDVHSAMARRMFPHIIPQDMPEIEIKKAFKKERDAAKPVTFGVPYQRGPEAIARQLNREAANNQLDAIYTKKDGEVFINAYKENFPRAWAYLEAQMRCVTSPRYQTSPWGFRRRYPNVKKDQKIVNKLEREASNWQIQHGVACTMMMSCAIWKELRREQPELPMFLIDILHDATKWLIHKSVLDVAPGLISRVMGDDLIFPKAFQHKNFLPIRHEIEYYHQWCGDKIDPKIIDSMAGTSIKPTNKIIENTVPSFQHLRTMYNKL